MVLCGLLDAHLPFLPACLPTHGVPSDVGTIYWRCCMVTKVFSFVVYTQTQKLWHGNPVRPLCIYMSTYYMYIYIRPICIYITTNCV